MNQLLPFNISLLDNKLSRLQNLMPIGSMDIYDTSGDFHPLGLYSSIIFGKPGDMERYKKHSYIDMKLTTMHPKIYFELGKLKGLYKDILEGRGYAIWDNEKKDFVKSDILEGKTGYAFFMEHFEELIFEKNNSLIRTLRINLLNKYRPNCMYRYAIVIPAGFRDIDINDDRVQESELGKLYRKLLRTSNTLPNNIRNINDEFDGPRRNLQLSFIEIYDYLFNVISDKEGFIQSKYGSRNIHDSTRNVITAMNPAPKVLGSLEAITIDDTIIGLHQYMMGSIYGTVYDIREDILKVAISEIPTTVKLIDKKSLKLTSFKPSRKIIELLNDDGIIKHIEHYEHFDNRWNYAEIEGYYIALICWKGDTFRIIYDIDDLPVGYDKSLVKPITWTELFYISCYPRSKKVGTYNTRYPVTENGSIYPSNVYLKVTIDSKIVKREIDNNGTLEYYQYNTYPIQESVFQESCSVHPSKVPALGADYDGDKMTFSIVMSEDAIKEKDEFLNSKHAYINPNGSLYYGANNSILEYVFHNCTRGLINE